jgi:single-strand DNA-binding protein
MTDQNHVFVIGRLTRDVGADERSFAYVGDGQMARANVSIAVNSSKRNGDQWVDDVNYFDVTIFGKLAESLKQYLTKGQQIAVDGTLKQDRWQKDGQNYSKVYIIANSVQLLGGKNNSQQQPTQTNQYQPAQQPQYQQRPAQPQQQYQQPQQQRPQGQSYSPHQNQQNDGGFPEDIPF